MIDWIILLIIVAACGLISGVFKALISHKNRQVELDAYETGWLRNLKPRRRVTMRNGLTIRVIDNRESYRRQRDIVGYEQVVSDADKCRAHRVILNHKERLGPIDNSFGASAQEFADALITLGRHS